MMIKKYVMILSMTLCFIVHVSAQNEAQVQLKKDNLYCPSNLECNFLKVPKNYDKPDEDFVDVYYGIHKANNIEKRKGILLLNFGGPGGAAVESTSMLVEDYFPKEIVDSFDIVGMDPRGSGESVFADELRQCGNIEEAECVALLETIAPFMGTNSVAKDMDRLRESLGEEVINYLGYSYGTRLGSIYTDLFPDRVRAFVLDSNMSPFLLDNEYINASMSESLEDIFIYRQGNERKIKMQTMINRSFYQDGYVSYDNYWVNEWGTSLVALLSIFNGDEYFVRASNNMLFNEDKLYLYHLFFGIGELLNKNRSSSDRLQQLKALFSHHSILNDDDLEMERFELMYTAVMCTDEPLDVITNEQDIFTLYKNSGELMGLPLHYLYHGLCQNWTAKKDTISYLHDIQSKLGNKKILLLGLKYDTNTPFPWSEDMHQAYGKNSIFVEVDNIVDHGISYRYQKFDCVNQRVTDYLLDPELSYEDKYCNFDENMSYFMPLKKGPKDFPIYKNMMMRLSR